MDTLLPTTMVGSWPRPSWFRYQLEGRDVLEAFKVIHHAEAFHDATRCCIKDQEDVGLDILTDGQMWFDDYSMGIGSFLWYWLERTGGFGKQKLPHPARARLATAVRRSVMPSPCCRLATRSLSPARGMKKARPSVTRRSTFQIMKKPVAR